MTTVAKAVAGERENMEQKVLRLAKEYLRVTDNLAAANEQLETARRKATDCSSVLRRVREELSDSVGINILRRTVVLEGRVVIIEHTPANGIVKDHTTVSIENAIREEAT